MGTIAGIAAYIGFCLGVLTLFSMADKAASPEGKVRARALLDFGWKDTVTQWPSVFVEMFDSIFGKRHLTWKCFGKSCLASLIAVAIVTLSYLANSASYVNGIMKMGIEALAMLIVFTVLFNFVPDFISLLETRFVLRLVLRNNNRPAVISLAILVDVLITFIIFTLGVFLIFRVLVGTEGSSLFEAFAEFSTTMLQWLLFRGDGNDTIETSMSIFLWSTFFTSIWLWLYALATFAGKLLLPILNRIEGFKKLVDLDNKPFLALGWLSVMIVTLLFALGAVVKACV